jgi:hypothetical protein
MVDETINTASQVPQKIDILVTRDPVTWQVLHNGHLIPALKSANITTIIFSFGFKLAEALQKLRLLSRNGYHFARTNKKYLENFCQTDLLDEYILRESNIHF